MNTHNDKVLSKAIEMSNNKPRVQVSREVLEHIDPAKKVRVYRNLHKGCLSVQQNGVVKCHTDNIVLHNFKTVVNKSGQERVRQERSKNVHSYIEGFVIDAKETHNGKLDFGWNKCYYNPYETDHWIDIQSGKFVDSGEYADITCSDVLAFNYLYRSEEK